MEARGGTGGSAGGKEAAWEEEALEEDVEEWCLKEQYEAAVARLRTHGGGGVDGEDAVMFADL